MIFDERDWKEQQTGIITCNVSNSNKKMKTFNLLTAFMTSCPDIKMMRRKMAAQ